MKYLPVFVALVVAVAYFQSCSATSEPVCGYSNSEGKMIFLRYVPGIKKGQDYVDFGADGKCIRRVTCLSDYTLKTEECADVKGGCKAKDSVFPKCCGSC